jgi:transposase
VEDLKVKGLSRGRLARSEQDAGWNCFFAKLCYKAQRAGRELVRVDRAQPTSQSRLCGCSVPKTLGIAGTNARRVDCPPRGMWSALKSYSNAPGSGVGEGG